MSKRWSLKDDRFLFEFFDTIGPRIGPRDLGRTEKATIDRVQKLKTTGAWKVLWDMYKQEYISLRHYYTMVGSHDDVKRLDDHHIGLDLIRMEIARQ